VTTKEQVRPLDLSAARLTQREKGEGERSDGRDHDQPGRGFANGGQEWLDSRVVTLVRYPEAAENV
jgi:hypothetical protein